jgi:hypothetical protein
LKDRLHQTQARDWGLLHLEELRAHYKPERVFLDQRDEAFQLDWVDRLPVWEWGFHQWQGEDHLAAHRLDFPRRHREGFPGALRRQGLPGGEDLEACLADRHRALEDRRLGLEDHQVGHHPGSEGRLGRGGDFLRQGLVVVS